MKRVVEEMIFNGEYLLITDTCGERHKIYLKPHEAEKWDAFARQIEEVNKATGEPVILPTRSTTPSKN